MRDPSGANIPSAGGHSKKSVNRVINREFSFKEDPNQYEFIGDYNFVSELNKIMKSSYKHIDNINDAGARSRNSISNINIDSKNLAGPLKTASQTYHPNFQNEVVRSKHFDLNPKTGKKNPKVGTKSKKRATRG